MKISKGKLKKDIKNLGEGKETSDITGMSEFITFYKAASNYKQREKMVLNLSNLI